MLKNPRISSTGTFGILCVILAMTRVAWCRLYANLSGRKTPPVGNNKHDFKKGLKGRLDVVVDVVATTAQTINAGLKSEEKP